MNTMQEKQSAKVEAIPTRNDTDLGSSCRPWLGPVPTCSVRPTSSGDRDDDSLCSVCGHNYAYDVKHNTGAKLIQCYFCLQWYYYDCEDIDDKFDDDVYMFYQCEDE
ncbi:hypothetical protein PR048_005964 [Dryococelus australis]|uniref:Uncharacterized protein n=1 Tax=Dryococelus australis TaxID=614101 RepID=A0ABQ9I9N1_9NEOP|nr:hypothetical protein PR048_005964 [Dryococelus australis]